MSDAHMDDGEAMDCNASSHAKPELSMLIETVTASDDRGSRRPTRQGTRQVNYVDKDYLEATGCDVFSHPEPELSMLDGDAATSSDDEVPKRSIRRGPRRSTTAEEPKQRNSLVKHPPPIPVEGGKYRCAYSTCPSNETDYTFKSVNSHYSKNHRPGKPIVRRRNRTPKHPSPVDLPDGKFGEEGHRARPYRTAQGFRRG